MNNADYTHERSSILIVDSDKNEGNWLKKLAADRGYSAETAFSGSEGRKKFCRNFNDLIILDMQLENAVSTDLIRDLRKCYTTPLIAVSSDLSEAAAVNALEAGADDFIPRPIRSEEMIARIKNALRHIQDRNICRCFFSGDLKVDFVTRTVSVKGKHIHLTQIEFSIMEILAANPGKILTGSYIVSRIWGESIKDTGRALRVNMANIRRKIESDTANPEYIITENGIGYRMNLIRQK